MEEVKHPAFAVYATRMAVKGKSGIARRMILQKISLALPEGSLAAVLGSSGCGKSALVRALAGVQSLSAGEVLLAGVPVRTLRKELPLAVAYVPSRAYFHPGLTVKEILELAGSLRLPGVVRPSMRQAWLKKVAKLTGVRALLRTPAEELTGGQMRRVALAEALIGDPAFLFIDELTRGLDPFTDYEVMSCLEELARQFGKTIVFATQILRSLSACDKILFLHEGRCCFQGGYRDLLAAHQTTSTRELFGCYHQASERGEFGELLFPTVEMPSEPEPQPLHSQQPASAAHQFCILIRLQALLLSRSWRSWWRGGLPLAVSLCLAWFSAIPGWHAPPAAANLTWVLLGLALAPGIYSGAWALAPPREIIQKDLLSGLSATAYVAARFAVIAATNLIQALVLALLVLATGLIHGEFVRLVVYFFVTMQAVGALSLALSAAARSSEQACLWALALLGLEVAFSGAGMALTEMPRAFLESWNTMNAAWNLANQVVLREQPGAAAPGILEAMAILALLLHSIIWTSAAGLIIRLKKSSLANLG